MDASERGRRLWDLVSGGYGSVDRWEAPLRAFIRDNIGLRPGDSALDIGCGTGTFLGVLREAVGPDGRIVAVDNSPRMVARTRHRCAGNGWQNVEVRVADAVTAPFGPAGFDAAIAVASLSAMPDTAAAIRNAHNALRPGGKLVVCDLRLVPAKVRSARWRFVVWVLAGIYRLLAGASGQDFMDQLRTSFATVRVLNTGPDGTAPDWQAYTVAVATKETVTEGAG